MAPEEEYERDEDGRITKLREPHKISASHSNDLLAGVITTEEKLVLQNNVDDYIRNDLIMSKHSLDIIQKLLDAC